MIFRVFVPIVFISILFIFSCCDKKDEIQNLGCFIVENPNTLSTCSYEIPPPPGGVEEILKVVENMPRFPGCEDSLSTKQEKYACSEALMNHFITSRLIYPELAVANQVEGEVVITFVVEEDGCLSGIKILRDIGCGCGVEAQKVIAQMPTWINGNQRGVPVRVQFNLPIKFEL